MSRRESGTRQGHDRLRADLPLGTIGGIWIRVSSSVGVIFALLASGLAAWLYPAANPQATLTYALSGVVTTAVFLPCSLAHELAHSLAARHYGLTVQSITRWLFAPAFSCVSVLSDPSFGSALWLITVARASAQNWTNCVPAALVRVPGVCHIAAPPLAFQHAATVTRGRGNSAAGANRALARGGRF